jgi:hypothetical protein
MMPMPNCLQHLSDREVITHVIVGTVAVVTPILPCSRSLHVDGSAEEHILSLYASHTCLSEVKVKFSEQTKDYPVEDAMRSKSFKNIGGNHFFITTIRGLRLWNPLTDTTSCKRSIEDCHLPFQTSIPRETSRFPSDSSS